MTPAGDLNEGDYVHLETRIEPRNDPYVIIEWYHNNQLIQTGQRLRPHHVSSLPMHIEFDLMTGVRIT